MDFLRFRLTPNGAATTGQAQAGQSAEENQREQNELYAQLPWRMGRFSMGVAAALPLSRG